MLFPILLLNKNTNLDCLNLKFDLKFVVEMLNINLFIIREEIIY